MLFYLFCHIILDSDGTGQDGKVHDCKGQDRRGQDMTGVAQDRGQVTGDRSEYSGRGDRAADKDRTE